MRFLPSDLTKDFFKTIAGFLFLILLSIAVVVLVQERARGGVVAGETEPLIEGECFSELC